MDKLEILEQQVKALEKLLEIKDKIIQELQTNRYFPSVQPLTINTPFISYGNCNHEYMSTEPFKCSKCGIYNIVVTSGTNG